MIIRWSQKYFTFRYLPMERKKAVSLFFQGGNVGYRRETFSVAGDFDPMMRACEDVDIGIRFSEHGKLFSQPSARVVHTSNFTFSKIMRQWWLTAIYQVKLMRKFTTGGIEVFSNTNATDVEATDHQCWILRPGSITVIVFLSSFLILNLSLAILLVALAFGAVPLAIGMGVIAASSAAKYFIPDFRRRDLPQGRRLRFCFIRLLVNEMLLLVSFVQGLRERMIYISHVYPAV